MSLRAGRSYLVKRNGESHLLRHRVPGRLRRGQGRQVRLGGPGRGSARVRERARAAGRDVPVRASDVRDDGLLGEPAERRSTSLRSFRITRVSGNRPTRSSTRRTLETVTSDRTRIERDFDPEAVRRLKATADHDLTVGGAELAAQAIEAGLVDELQLFLVPVVVGGGKRALPDAGGPRGSRAARRAPVRQRNGLPALRRDCAIIRRSARRAPTSASARRRRRQRCRSGAR